MRVHEHLLARADLSRKDRDRAQHALAQDFLKAGLLDRAEAALHKLQGTAHENESLLSLLAIYERSRDWAQAQTVAQRLEDTQQGSFVGRLAHYQCELAELDLRQGQVANAQNRLQAATVQAPTLARAWIALAALQAQQNDLAAAFESLCSLAEHAPQALPLAAQLVVTEIDADFEGDAFAPLLGPDWHETERSQHMSAQGLAYSLVTLERQ